VNITILNAVFGFILLDLFYALVIRFTWKVNLNRFILARKIRRFFLELNSFRSETD